MTILFDVTAVEQALDSILKHKYPAIDYYPVILISNAAARASRADELAVVLRDIDETRSAVTRLETRLEQLVTCLHQRRAPAIT